MLNIKRRIFAGAYIMCVFIMCVFNFAAVVFYNFELLDAKGVMDLFVSIAFIVSFALILDLHRFFKESRENR